MKNDPKHICIAQHCMKCGLDHCSCSACPESRDGATSLLIASAKGDLPAVKLLLSKGARPDEADEKKNTALMLAAIPGHIEIVKLIVDSGANVNTVNTFGSTAVMLAAENRHADIVSFLTGARCEHGPQGRRRKDSSRLCGGK